MIRFRVEKGISRDGFSVWLLEDRHEATYIAKPIDLVFEKIEEGFRLPNPTLFVPGPFAQELVPQLKKALAGYEFWDDKEEYDKSKRMEKALQDHIESLRKALNMTHEHFMKVVTKE